jgi:hypothetical protein
MLVVRCLLRMTHPDWSYYKKMAEPNERSRSGKGPVHLDGENTSETAERKRPFVISFT